MTSPDRLPSDIRWTGGLCSIEPVDTEVVNDVRVDPDAPMLSFREGAAACSYWVDEESISALRLVADNDAPIVELNLDCGEGQLRTVLLAADGRQGPGHWQAARIIRLDGMFASDDGTALQSFWIQVSAVLAELQHHLRQPLTAISLAAHNGSGLLEIGEAEKARKKFAYVVDQVDHCEDRMQQRVARFGTGAMGKVVLPLILAFHSVIAPRGMTECAEDGDEAPWPTPAAMRGPAPHGSNKVLLRYIVRRMAVVLQRNSSDRLVDIILRDDPGALRITIRYPASAEENNADADDVMPAFARRLMEQIGGEFLMPNVLERQEGIAATLLFFCDDQANLQAMPQLAFANSSR